MPILDSYSVVLTEGSQGMFDGPLRAKTWR